MNTSNWFKAIDELLLKSTIQRLSVKRTLGMPTSFEQIGSYLETHYPENRVLLNSFGLEMFQYIKNQLFYFPENIFWDYNYFSTSIFQEVLKSSTPSETLEDYFFKLNRLLKIFGKDSMISFRYMHDFLYGFDWAKWVRKEPENRKHIAPFEMRFLDYIALRGKELETLIEKNDRKYHKILEGVYRNPFAFSRNIKDETRLLQSLATDGFIPIEGWDYRCTPNWQLPFNDLRKERAKTLAIPLK